ncbi:hypothetical protein L1D14_07770 [Vibrio tubiashii]|uniref:hypothetical protein n=1 Tax=Vibrio tubiashii TaxID=29498 RepID=UPI001EFC8EC3|nr:hypothetical protein [Vibrio tubiashii]MCG9576137.1 hypothetical protein [Vibrio tubiashii]
MNKWTFTVPDEDLKAPRLLILGNFIAEKASGYYNGNKTSWHVYEVEWIIGEFEPHQNDECDLGHKVINKQNYDYKSVRSNGKICFVTVRKIADTDKRNATKLMREHHGQKGCVVAWSESGVNSEPTRHEIKE